MSAVKVELPNGIEVYGNSGMTTDKQAMRTLIESGLSYRAVAAKFHITEAAVRCFARQGGWMTASKVQKLKKEIEQRQNEALARNGSSMDVAEVKAAIWKDRGEYLKEKTFEIAKHALDGVSPEQAKRMIKNPLGLQHMTTVIRTITGEQQEQEMAAPRFALNIGLLRANTPTDASESVVLEA
jgi:predicted transcriptional regulator